jgi:hypothetical protein
MRFKQKTTTMKTTKTLYLLLILLFVTNQQLLSQSVVIDKSLINDDYELEASTSVDSLKYLDINNVLASIKSYGVLFNNGNGYYVPVDENIKSIFSASLWIGGLYQGGNLHISGERFNQIGYNYMPGPLYEDNLYGNCENNISNYFNRVWKINREDISEFYSNYNAGEDVSMFTDIIEWPGTGPQGYDIELAPYIDENGDGLYNATEHGDVPDMIGDQMLWWVTNDVISENREIDALPLGVQIEYTLYGYVYENPPNELLDLINYQTFLKMKITNKSVNTYNSVYFGLFVDGDLGCPYDDYVGCDVERNSFYFYNGTEIDENCTGFLGYGENPPIQTVTLLNTPNLDAPLTSNSNNGITDNEQTGMSKFVYFNNSSQGGHPATTDPATAVHHYNFLKGFWKDGQHLCYGGTGHPSGGGNPDIPCDYMFFGNTDTLFTGTNGIAVAPWTEEDCQNSPDDRRGLMGMGPVTFSPGEVVEIDVLFGFIPQDNQPAKGTGKFDYGYKLDTIINWFHQNTIPSSITGIEDIEIKQPGIKQTQCYIYPNPVNNELNILCEETIKEIKLFDLKGNCVKRFVTNSKNLQLNIAELNYGFYFVSVKGKDFSCWEKLVKQ